MDETAKQVIRRSLVTVVVNVCHVVVILVYLGGGIVTELIRRRYAHGVSWVVALFLEGWFGWITVHRAVMEWIMLQRRNR